LFYSTNSKCDIFLAEYHLLVKANNIQTKEWIFQKCNLKQKPGYVKANFFFKNNSSEEEAH
jgi:hypothetical protein